MGGWKTGSIRKRASTFQRCIKDTICVNYAEVEGCLQDKQLSINPQKTGFFKAQTSEAQIDKRQTNPQNYSTKEQIFEKLEKDSGT